MRKAWMLGFLLASWALAQGRLEAGVYGGPGGWTPTLEAALALEGGEAYVRLQGERGALGLAGGLSLGPLGFLAYGAQGEVGAGGLGGVAFAEGVPAPWPSREGSATARKGSSPSSPRRGFLAASTCATAWCPGGWWASSWREKGVCGPRPPTPCGPRPPTPWGRGSPPGPTWSWAGRGRWGRGWRSWTWPCASGVNRLEAALYLGEASLFLTLSHPWAGSVGAWLGDLGLEVGYQKAPYAWVRYAWRWP